MKNKSGKKPVFTTSFASSSAITNNVSSSSPNMYFTYFDTANFSSCVAHTWLHFSYSKRTSCTFTKTSSSWSSQHCRDFSLLCTFAHFPLVVPFVFILFPLLLYFLHRLKHGSLFYQSFLSNPKALIPTRNSNERIPNPETQKHTIR